MPGGPEDSCIHFGAGAGGSARFVLLGEPFHGAGGPCGLGGLRFVALLLGEQLLGPLASGFKGAVAFSCPGGNPTKGTLP